MLAKGLDSRPHGLRWEMAGARRYAAMLTVPLCSRTEHGTYLKIRYEYVLPIAEKNTVRYVRKANLFEIHPWRSDTLDTRFLLVCVCV